jgi:hypothetical protein
MNPQKTIFWALLLIAVVIALYKFRTSSGERSEKVKTVVVKMVDIKQAPPNYLRSYNVEIVLDTPSRFIFNQYLNVNVPVWPDKDAVCAYSYDRTTGIGTWTQTYPTSNGTFQMYPEGKGWRIVQTRANGEFLTESLLVYSYRD